MFLSLVQVSMPFDYLRISFTDTITCNPKGVSLIAAHPNGPAQA